MKTKEELNFCGLPACSRHLPTTSGIRKLVVFVCVCVLCSWLEFDSRHHMLIWSYRRQTAECCDKWNLLGKIKVNVLKDDFCFLTLAIKSREPDNICRVCRSWEAPDDMSLCGDASRPSFPTFSLLFFFFYFSSCPLPLAKLLLGQYVWMTSLLLKGSCCSSYIMPL